MGRVNLPNALARDISFRVWPNNRTLLYLFTLPFIFPVNFTFFIFLISLFLSLSFSCWDHASSMHRETCAFSHGQKVSRFICIVLNITIAQRNYIVLYCITTTEHQSKYFTWKSWQRICLLPRRNVRMFYIRRVGGKFVYLHDEMSECFTFEKSVVDLFTSVSIYSCSRKYSNEMFQQTFEYFRERL